MTAVEGDKRLSVFGNENASNLRIEKNLKFIHSKVETFLAKNNLDNIDLVIADPPRSGLSSLVSNFDNQKQIILISCHLPSFVRDTKLLVGRGWKVDLMQPFDMFSRTSHIELLGSFIKE